MTFLRTVAIAAWAGITLPSAPVHACDSNYPWLCKPVPSISQSEATAESSTPGRKPLQITGRRAGAAATLRADRTARAAKTRTSARLERSAHVSRKHAARKSATRRWAVRARNARLAAARVENGDAVKLLPTASAKTTAGRREAAQRVGLPRADGADGNSTNAGFAAIWGERSTGATEAREADREIVTPAAEPVTGGPVQVASQNDVNELDLAAAEPTATSDGFWLRGLFLAFGGLVAFGSALRLFL